MSEVYFQDFPITYTLSASDVFIIDDGTSVRYVSFSSLSSFLTK